MDKPDRINRQHNGSGFLRRILSDGRLLLSMFRDIIRRRYRQIPWWTLAAATVALLYVINPFDVVPDFIAGFGYIDDAVVVALCLRLTEKDLRKYREWREAEE